MAKQTVVVVIGMERFPPVWNCKYVIAGLERLGYEVRCIAAGFDGKRKWAVHRPDPSTAKYYQPRSYYDAEGLMSLASLPNKQALRDAIAAAHQATSKNKYIRIREDENVKKDTSKKTTAAAEKATREARIAKTAKSTKAAPKASSKKDAAKAPAAKVTKKATGKNGNGVVDENDPDVKFLASYQDQTTTERMTANNMVKLYKRIKATTYDTPVANSTLNLYDKRQARELARLGIVAKERIPDVGLAYFAVSK